MPHFPCGAVFAPTSLHFHPHPIPRHHRQPLQTRNQIGSPQMRVAIHRQADRRVPGKRLGNLRRTIGRDQIGDETVAKGMEIHNLPHSIFRFKVITGFPTFPFLSINGFVQPRLSCNRQVTPQDLTRFCGIERQIAARSGRQNDTLALTSGRNESTR